MPKRIESEAMKRSSDKKSVERLTKRPADFRSLCLPRCLSLFLSSPAHGSQVPVDSPSLDNGLMLGHHDAHRSSAIPVILMRQFF